MIVYLHVYAIIYLCHTLRLICAKFASVRLFCIVYFVVTVTNLRLFVVEFIVCFQYCNVILSRQSYNLFTSVARSSFRLAAGLVLSCTQFSCARARLVPPLATVATTAAVAVVAATLVKTVVSAGDTAAAATTVFTLVSMAAACLLSAGWPARRARCPRAFTTSGEVCSISRSHIQLMSCYSTYIHFVTSIRRYEVNLYSNTCKHKDQFAQHSYCIALPTTETNIYNVFFNTYCRQHILQTVRSTTNTND